jgi:hypothetical protein
LFTCTLVLSSPAGKEGWAWNMSRWSKQQDTGWAKNKQEEYSWRRAARVSVQTWIEAMKDVSARCSKKMAVQVRTKLWLYKCATERNCHELYITLSVLDYNCSCSQVKFAILIDVYFSQVENKPWLSWVYSWIRHRHEQTYYWVKT